MEVPPASFMPKNLRGLAPACEGIGVTVHHAALTLQATIDFSPMPDSEDLNNNRTVINSVQNAVIPYSRPVPFFTLQLLDSRHIWVIAKGLEAGDDFLEGCPVFSLDFL